MLFGFFFDNIVVFLFRTFRLSWLDYRSKDWTITEGIVEEARPYKDLYPYAVADYTYKARDESHHGVYRRGFWSNDSAEHFTGLYPSSKEIRVRYNPVRSSESFLCEGDQRIEQDANRQRKANELGPARTPFGNW